MKEKISIINIILVLLMLLIIIGTISILVINNNPSLNNKELKYKKALGKYKTTFDKSKQENNIDSNKITDYIPNIFSKDIFKYSIENNNLIYTGKDDLERMWSSEMNVYTSRLKEPVLNKKYSLNSSNYYKSQIDTNDKKNSYINYVSLDNSSFINSYIVKYDKYFNKIWQTTIFKNIESKQSYKVGKNVYFITYSYSNADKISSILNISDINGEIIWETENKDNSNFRYWEILKINNKTMIALATTISDVSKLHLVEIDIENGNILNIEDIEINDEYEKLVVEKCEKDKDGNILLLYIASEENEYEKTVIYKMDTKGNKLFEISFREDVSIIFNNLMRYNNSLSFILKSKEGKFTLNEYNVYNGELLRKKEFNKLFRNIIKIFEYGEYLILITEQPDENNNEIRFIDKDFNEIWNVTIDDEDITNVIIDDKFNTMNVYSIKKEDNKFKNFCRIYEFK